MDDPLVERLILDLLEWLRDRQELTYEEVMDAWRTSCPRFPVWEDATDGGLVTIQREAGRNLVRLTVAGTAYLAQRRGPG